MTDAPETPLRVGKLPPDLLDELLTQAGVADPSVILGPRMGEDAALIDAGHDAGDSEKYLVVSSDPITFAADQLGWYAVHVNANDIAATGGTPRWMVMTVILPDGAPPQLARDIMRQTLDACAEIGVTLVGGHTEVTHGIDRPIAIGTMVGEVARGSETPTSGARVGDAIILTKGVGIEGTAILAIERADRLRGAGVPEGVIGRAAQFLHAPGISVVRDAAIAVDLLASGAGDDSTLRAMHDPTEGGVATALHELADASGIGLDIDADALSDMTAEETEAICRALGVDPLGLIAAGALLIATHPYSAGGLLAGLADSGITARVIGHAVPRSRGVSVPRFDRDELARVLEG